MDQKVRKRKTYLKAFCAANLSPLLKASFPALLYTSTATLRRSAVASSFDVRINWHSSSQVRNRSRMNLASLMLFILKHKACLFVCWTVALCLSNIQSTPQVQTCLDDFVRCHTETYATNQIYYRILSYYSDTEQTSSSADPIASCVQQWGHFKTILLSQWYDFEVIWTTASTLKADVVTTKPLRPSENTGLLVCIWVYCD